MKNTIILKIGGSIITDRTSEIPKANINNMRRVAEEIKEVYKAQKIRIILIHGAGSYGHQIVKKTGIDKGAKTEKQLIAFAETQRLQNELNSIFTKSLINKGIPAIPYQASAHAVMKSGRLVKMDLDVLTGLLDAGLIPVLYGVPAYDIECVCSILSGDQIAPFLAENLNIKRIIHGTDVDGIFTSDPKKDNNAKLIKEINLQNIEQVRQWLGGSTAIDVTGGMFGKVTELINIAKDGVESQIINALKHGNVRRALLGDKTIGTVIRDFSDK